MKEILQGLLCGKFRLRKHGSVQEEENIFFCLQRISSNMGPWFFSLGSSTYNFKIISKFYWYVLAIFPFVFFLHHFFHFNDYFVLYPQSLVPDHPHSMQNHEALIIGHLLSLGTKLFTVFTCYIQTVGLITFQ